jgi:hypothetical protein
VLKERTTKNSNIARGSTAAVLAIRKPTSQIQSNQFIWPPSFEKFKRANQSHTKIVLNSLK